MAQVAVPQGDYALCTIINASSGKPWVITDRQPQRSYLRVEATGPGVDRCKKGDTIVAVGPEHPGFDIDGVKFILVDNAYVGAVLKDA